jgi:Nif-specific regulatory protein
MTKLETRLRDLRKKLDKKERKITSLKETLRTRDYQLGIIKKGSMIAVSPLKVKEVLKSILDLVTKAMKTEIGSIMLVDKSSNQLFIEVAKGLEGEIVENTRVNIGENISGWVAKTGEPLLVHDIEEDPRFKEKYAFRYKTKSLISVPLKVKDEIIGVLNINNKMTKEEFGEKDLIMLSALTNQIAAVLENSRLFEEVRDLRESFRAEDTIVSESPVMKETLKTVGRVARANSTVLLRGESGSGKELIARFIHYNSSRRHKPFVCVNCTALPENLLESELFGHEKGAFTGADSKKLGRFELADGGTVFLDEIGETSTTLQLKLLRVLQEREFERVGGTETVKVNVRILAATNKNLEEAIKKMAFREDLYYRLNVVTLFLAPLRERKEDIPLLSKYFLRIYNQRMSKRVSEISPQTMDLLLKYPWPGNVRELRNIIERALVLGSKDRILPEHLPLEVQMVEKKSYPQAQKNLPLREMEKQHITEVLQAVKGNKTKAASLLGIDRSTLYEKIKAYNIK